MGEVSRDLVELDKMNGGEQEKLLNGGGGGCAEQVQNPLSSCTLGAILRSQFVGVH